MSPVARVCAFLSGAAAVVAWSWWHGKTNGASMLVLLALGVICVVLWPRQRPPAPKGHDPAWDLSKLDKADGVDAERGEFR